MKTKNLRTPIALFVIFIVIALGVMPMVIGQTIEAKPNSSQKKTELANSQSLVNNDNLSVQRTQRKSGIEPRTELVVQTGHSAPVFSVSFNPDGKTLASAGSDKSIKLWNVETGRELRTLSGHFLQTNTVAFNSDGKLLASGSLDKTIKIWDVETGNELRTLLGHSSSVSKVSFSPDGKILASSSLDQTVKFWDAKSGEELKTFFETASGISSLAFSPNGKFIVTGRDNKTVELWDVENSNRLKIFKGHSSYITSVAFSSDGKTIASGSGDKTIRLWNVITGKLLRSLKGHSDYISEVSFSPDGKTLASASSDKTIKLWDIVSGKELITLDNNSSVFTVSFGFDEKKIASGNSDNTIKIWDLITGKEIRTLTGHPSAVHSVAFSSDGNTLASVSSDKSIKLWDMENGKELRLLSGHTAYINSISFSADGKILASGSSDKTIKIWEVESGKELKTLKGHTDYILSISIRSDGEILASGGGFDSLIRLWDVESGKELKTLKGHSNNVSNVIFSADGKLLASSGGDNTIKIWDVESGRELITLSGHSSSIGSLAFSSDGKTLASGSYDNSIKLWDIESGKELRTLSGHSHYVSSVSFSSDGKSLVSGSWDRTIRLWDIESGKELKTLTGHTDIVWSVSFNSDEKFLASVSEDRKTKLWDVATGKELCSLIVIDEKNWVVTTPDGRFDTNKILNPEGIHWVVSDDPMKPVPLEIFMRDYYEPKLLPRLLKCNEKKNCDEEFSPLPNIAELNRVQPRVKITNVSLPDETRKVKVTVEVSKGAIPAKDCKMKRCETDAFDLRLFRDGQLVGNFPDDGQERLIKGREDEIADINQRKALWREATKISLDGKIGKKTLTFDVQLPKGRNVADIDFTAYAFNEDRVKSDTARWNWTDEAKAKLPKAEKVNRRAFILSVGVNASENERWRLQFAARDATETQRILTEKLKAVGEYEILNIPLISDYDVQKNLLTNDAVKKKIEAVFALLAGKKLNDEQKKLIDEIKQNAPDVARLFQTKPTPDDMVIISFSSHGYADNRGNFYLLPYDIGKESREMKDAIHLAISSDELSLWLRDVDAGDMAMIIDACHAAASVENREFKPGPMGSRGLGQLAYDKDMKILTATKASDVALEVGGRLNQGLLSYALLQEGLEKSLADFKASDGKVFLKEWLEYGETRVPSLYDDVKNNRLKDAKGVVLKGSEPLTTVLNKQDTYQQRPSLFDFSRKTSNIIISTQKP